MTDLADLFPGFTTRRFETEGASILARVGGSGPPLLCLHGFPQCHVMWHRVAGELARHFTVVLPDLRGYGQSRGPQTTPAGDPEHFAYSKRAMALDCVQAMRQLGHDRFMVASHDRGARVGYRLALDHPERVERLVTLDVVTTLDAWSDMTIENAVGRFHWAFLARPAPFPETVIGQDPGYFLEYLLAQWTAARDLSAFDPRALDHYRHWFAQPATIRACCEDYRAGAGCDVAFDRADREAGRKLAQPLLALWGGSRKHGFVDKPLESWRRWADDVQGEPVECGHFLPEEAPAETLRLLLPFLRATRLCSG